MPVVDDETRLAEMGYKQELNRTWGVLQNFGVSFAIISVITGITTLFQFGLNTGGPGVMSVGWIIVSFFTMFVALAMAEIVSAVPTSGGPYYWAAVLVPDKYSPVFSWYTGWTNFVGQFAVSCGIIFGLANLITLAAVVLGGFEATPGKTIGIHAALLVAMGLINTFGMKILGILNNVSIAFHSIGVFSIAVATVAKAPTRQSGKFVFATFNDATGLEGFQTWGERASPAYVAIIGILLAQYTITGFDASAHLSEETKNAARSAPIGVLTSVGASAVFGFFLLVCLLFSIQDFDTTVAAPQPVIQIFLDVFGKNGTIGIVVIWFICVFFCGTFSICSNSRMFFAFARDRGIPRIFAKVDPTFHSPVYAIWLAVLLAFLLALPSLNSAVAFSAATSIATIGLYVSYALPIVARLIWPSHFVPGPFYLGRLASSIIAIIAVCWVVFITVVFCLPTANPVNKQTLNYSIVAVAIVIGYATILWFVAARKYFTGPRRQIELEAAGIDVTDPTQAAEADRILAEKEKEKEKDV